MSVSIVIPTYNRKKFEALIEYNINIQDYFNLIEVIILDDSDVEVTTNVTTETSAADVAVDDAEPQLPVRIRLRRDLLKNYDKIVHPVRDPKSSIKVS